MDTRRALVEAATTAPTIRSTRCTTTSSPATRPAEVRERFSDYVERTGVEPEHAPADRRMP